MDMSRMTQKVNEALAAAQQLAVRLSHQQVDGEHVLAELLAQQDGLASRLLERAGASPEAFKTAVQQSLAKRPKVTGSAVEADKVYITQRLQQLLVKAGDEAEKMQDEYISVEHLLLAMIAEGNN
ncbi:MAG: Clp protease N-terminal domain-containing protein, partial [Mariprofundus sp.]|nr:Clp protease N-terminal domain-containing protein [Mariprofundus sp.]